MGAFLYLSKKILTMKFLFLYLFVVYASGSYAQLVHLPLDENDGSNIQVNGATPAPNRFGTANTAYHFDGLDDKIILGNTLSINNQISIAFWIKPEAYNRAIISFTGDDYPYDGRINGITIDQQGHIVFEDESNDWGFVFSATPIELNNWAHVCITSTLLSFNNGDVFESKIYLNGILSAEYSNASPSNPVFDGQPFFDSGLPGHLILGGGLFSEWTNSVKPAFQGSIDDLKIYDTILSVQEVNQLLPNKSYVKDVAIYPNPASSFVTVGCGNEAKTTIEIVDLLGQRIYLKEHYGNAVLDVKNFTSGTYFIRIFNKSDSIPIIKKLLIRS